MTTPKTPENVPGTSEEGLPGSTVYKGRGRPLHTDQRPLAGSGRKLSAYARMSQRMDEMKASLDLLHAKVDKGRCRLPRRRVVMKRLDLPPVKPPSGHFTLTVWEGQDLYRKNGQSLSFPACDDAFSLYRKLQEEGEVELSGAVIQKDGYDVMRWDGNVADDINDVQWLELPTPYELKVWALSDIYRKSGESIYFTSESDAFSVFCKLQTQEEVEIVAAELRHKKKRVMWWDSLVDDTVYWAK